MPLLNVATVGDSLTAAGAVILTSPAPFLRLKAGLPAAAVGSTVAGHGSGAHASATMIDGSKQLKLNGLGAAITLSAASCGHTAVGSSHLLLAQ